MGQWLVAHSKMRRSWPFWINPTHPEVLFAQHEDGTFTAHPRLMFSYDAVASGAQDPVVFAGRVPVQARERKGTFFTTCPPLAVAPIVAPPPPNTFFKLLPTLDQWERDLFDTCQFLVPYHEVLHIVCTESVMFVSDGGAAIPKASFGWVLSTNQGQRLLHVSGPAYGAHSNSYRAEGYGILSVMRFLFRVQSFVTAWDTERLPAIATTKAWLLPVRKRRQNRRELPTPPRLLIMMCWPRFWPLVTCCQSLPALLCCTSRGTRTRRLHMNSCPSPYS